MTELIARVRLLGRDASHTLAVVLSLAIGMAVCVAVFSLVNIVVFATVPGISERPRLVHLTGSHHGGRFTPAEFERLAQQSTRCGPCVRTDATAVSLVVLREVAGQAEPPR